MSCIIHSNVCYINVNAKRVLHFDALELIQVKNIYSMHFSFNILHYGYSSVIPSINMICPLSTENFLTLSVTTCRYANRCSGSSSGRRFGNHFSLKSPFNSSSFSLFRWVAHACCVCMCVCM